MVVLLMITPSMSLVARTAAATSATSNSISSGAIFSSSFGQCAFVDEAAAGSRAEATPASSSWSGVRLCMPLAWTHTLVRQ